MFSDVVWQIQKFRSCDIESNSSIKGGQIVRFRHTELDSYLSADISYQGGQSECYLGKYVGDYDVEQKSINSLWEIEVDVFHKRGQACRLLNEASKPQSYRLRHLLTGKLLNFQEANLKVQNAQQKRVIMCLKTKQAEETLNDEDPASQVVFRSTTKSQEKYLQLGSCYNIGFTKGFFGKCIQPQCEFTQKESKPIPGFYQGMADEEQYVQRLAIELA